MPVTSREVARLAQVSQATVSRVLSGQSNVADPTRLRVLAAAQQLGYVRNELGRNLRTRSTRQIAMVADLENRLYPALMPALHDRLGEAGYRLIMLGERPEHSTLVARLFDRSIDGVVLTTTFLDSALPAELQRHHVPFVYLTRFAETTEADSATVDNRAGAEAVGRLLVELGHRRIGAIFSSPRTSTGRDRENGFRGALAEAGLGLPASNVAYGWYSYEHGMQGMSRILQVSRRPTAIFCANDLIAAGALAEAHRRSVRVPEELTVVGFDDLDIASWPWLDLTTVRSPLAEMAEAAATMLLERLIDCDLPSRHRVWSASMVLRSTHAQPGVPK